MNRCIPLAKARKTSSLPVWATEPATQTATLAATVSPGASPAASPALTAGIAAPNGDSNLVLALAIGLTCMAGIVGLAGLPAPAQAQATSTDPAIEAADKALQDLLQREALARQTAALPALGMRAFPVSAKRGFMEVLAPPEVIVNGTPERLSPGHRIRGPNNMLVMSGQLAGRKLVVNYVRNPQGELQEVWILTAREAQEEREGSGPIRNFRFDSEGNEAKKPP